MLGVITPNPRPLGVIQDTPAPVPAPVQPEPTVSPKDWWADRKLALYGGEHATGFKTAKPRMWGKVDRKPRFEIDDSQANIRNPRDLTESKTPVPLGAIMSHDALFQQYPDLKKLGVIVHGQNDLIDNNPDALGQYDPKTDVLHVRKPVETEGSAEDFKTSVIHELQHAIQKREGFAYGTPGSMFSYEDKPGEWEAYNVQSRMNLTPEERAKMPPPSSLYQKDPRRLGAPQVFDKLGDDVWPAMEAELSRRFDAKEPMPPGFENWKPAKRPTGTKK